MADEGEAEKVFSIKKYWKKYSAKKKDWKSFQNVIMEKPTPVQTQCKVHCENMWTQTVHCALQEILQGHVHMFVRLDYEV